VITAVVCIVVGWCCGAWMGVAAATRAPWYTAAAAQARIDTLERDNHALRAALLATEEDCRAWRVRAERAELIVRQRTHVVQ
jgi:dienelactone hydrolase